MPVEGRDLSSRRTQHVVRDLEIGEPINSEECSETAEGVARESEGKEGMQHVTSIALFANDVECLLRELYGDVKSDALNDVLRAIRAMVECALPSLRKEDYHADAIDYVVGIGLPEGYGLSGSDHDKAAIAADALTIRAMQVTADPGAYCRYTNKFVRALDKDWPTLGGWDRRRNGSRSNVDDEKVYYQV